MNLAAEVTFKYTQTKNKVVVSIYGTRTSSDKFCIGVADFFLNYDGLANPALIWARSKYNSKKYEPVKVVNFTFNFKLFAIEIKLKSGETGIVMSGKCEKLVTVELTKLKQDFTIKWRMQDTAMVTPEFITINTTYQQKQ